MYGACTLFTPLALGMFLLIPCLVLLKVLRPSLYSFQAASLWAYIRRFCADAVAVHAQTMSSSGSTVTGPTLGLNGIVGYAEEEPMT